MNTLIYYLVLGLVKCFQALPLRALVAIGRGGGALAYALDARHRRVAIQNLTAAFPGKTEAEIRELARENLKRLGENYCCAIKTAVMKPDDLRKHLEFAGTEKLVQGREYRISRVFAIGHFGNFELYARGNLVLPEYQFATTYRALEPPGLNRVLTELRSESGCLLFERRTDSEALRAAVRSQPLILGFLSDQHAGRSGAWIPFFGRVCSTTTAPAVFALRYKLPLYPAFCFRIAPGQWRIEVGEEIPTIREGERRAVEDIMLDVNRAFEAAIQRDPPNWFWVHRRWKPPPERVAPHKTPAAASEQAAVQQNP